MKSVLEALPTRNPWTILNFLAHPDDRLDGRRPIDVLKGGDIDLVVKRRDHGSAGGVSAPPPPADLANREPEFVTVRPSAIVHRFYTATFDPLFFDRSLDGG